MQAVRHQVARTVERQFMEPIHVVVLAILAIPIALAIWLIARAIQAKDGMERLSRRLNTLEVEILRLKRDRESARADEPAPAPRPATTFVAPPVAPQAPVAAPPPPFPRKFDPLPRSWFRPWRLRQLRRCHGRRPRRQLPHRCRPRRQSGSKLPHSKGRQPRRPRRRSTGNNSWA